MSKQYRDLLELYKNYIKIFNNWDNGDIGDKMRELNYKHLSNVFRDLTDILSDNGIIEHYGIKHYRVIESGEIL